MASIADSYYCTSYKYGIFVRIVLFLERNTFYFVITSINFFLNMYSIWFYTLLLHSHQIHTAFLVIASFAQQQVRKGSCLSFHKNQHIALNSYCHISMNVQLSDCTRQSTIYEAFSQYYIFSILVRIVSYDSLRFNL